MDMISLFLWHTTFYNDFWGMGAYPLTELDYWTGLLDDLTKLLNKSTTVNPLVPLKQGGSIRPWNWDASCIGMAPGGAPTLSL